jgi:hypothetical protein
MREFERNGVHWSVRELGGAEPSGLRVSRCLIFDSEAIVRRVWVYPADWDQLGDDQLWQLMCGVVHVVAPFVESHVVTAIDERSVSTLEAETAARAQALLAEIALLRTANHRLMEAHRALRESCREQRDAMRRAVEAFASTMRAEGVAPEKAIVRIKDAVTGGVGPATAVEDPDAESMLHDAVTWGIAAYYAA